MYTKKPSCSLNLAKRLRQNGIDGHGYHISCALSLYMLVRNTALPVGSLLCDENACVYYRYEHGQLSPDWQGSYELGTFLPST